MALPPIPAPPPGAGAAPPLADMAPAEDMAPEAADEETVVCITRNRSSGTYTVYAGEVPDAAEPVEGEAPAGETGTDGIAADDIGGALNEARKLLEAADAGSGDAFGDGFEGGAVEPPAPEPKV